MEKITLTATIDAPINKVWESYVAPAHITQWNQASDDWHCPAAKNDLQVGGTYFARMEAKDGSMGFDFTAIYNEVVPYKKITYTIPDGRQATTEFVDLGNAVQVTTTFDAENQNPVALQKEGWQAILNNFKNYTEQNNNN